jgi:hypothetical protein
MPGKISSHARVYIDFYLDSSLRLKISRKEGAERVMTKAGGEGNGEKWIFLNARENHEK